jgi:hypothetical protein
VVFSAISVRHVPRSGRETHEHSAVAAISRSRVRTIPLFGRTTGAAKSDFRSDSGRSAPVGDRQIGDARSYSTVTLFARLRG